MGSTDYALGYILENNGGIWLNAEKGRTQEPSLSQKPTGNQKCAQLWLSFKKRSLKRCLTTKLCISQATEPILMVVPAHD